MSKVIKLTPEIITKCRQDFEQALKLIKMSDGKFNFSKTFDEIKEKATVYFTELAWYKMQALISEFSKEVAWHGVAHRSEDADKNEYYITDILVYPQEVTGATVDMNVSKYDEWIRKNYEDERFYSIGMQGHSHVNMGVSPSGTDLGHQETILSQLTDDMFYIFMIWNKSGSRNVRIFDLAKNILFENEDVTIKVLDGDMGISSFIEEARSMVTEKTYQYTGYDWYNKNKTVTQTETKTEPKDDKKDEKKENTAVDYNKEKSAVSISSNQKKKKKGKRKKNKKRHSHNYEIYDEDYDDAFYYSGN